MKVCVAFFAALAVSVASVAVAANRCSDLLDPASVTKSFWELDRIKQNLTGLNRTNVTRFHLRIFEDLTERKLNPLFLSNVRFLKQVILEVFLLNPYLLSEGKIDQTLTLLSNLPPFLGNTDANSLGVSLLRASELSANDRLEKVQNLLDRWALKWNASKTLEPEFVLETDQMRYGMEWDPKWGRDKHFQIWSHQMDRDYFWDGQIESFGAFTIFLKSDNTLVPEYRGDFGNDHAIAEKDFVHVTKKSQKLLVVQKHDSEKENAQWLDLRLAQGRLSKVHLSQTSNRYVLFILTGSNEIFVWTKQKEDLASPWSIQFFSNLVQDSKNAPNVKRVFESSSLHSFMRLSHLDFYLDQNENVVLAAKSTGSEYYLPMWRVFNFPIPNRSRPDWLDQFSTPAKPASLAKVKQNFIDDRKQRLSQDAERYFRDLITGRSDLVIGDVEAIMANIGESHLRGIHFVHHRDSKFISEVGYELLKRNILPASDWWILKVQPTSKEREQEISKIFLSRLGSISPEYLESAMRHVGSLESPEEIRKSLKDLPANYRDRWVKVSFSRAAEAGNKGAIYYLASLGYVVPGASLSDAILDKNFDMARFILQYVKGNLRELNYRDSFGYNLIDRARVHLAYHTGSFANEIKQLIKEMIEAGAIDTGPKY